MNQILILSLLAVGCAVTPKEKANPSLFTQEDFEKSSENSINIEYILGRDSYRLLFELQGNEVRGKTYHDKKVVEAGSINRQKYPLFLKKTFDFIHSAQTETDNKMPCYSPFSIVVRLENKTETVKGCRSRDHGRFSKLIRDGEFLLYSKNE